MNLQHHVSQPGYEPMLADNEPITKYSARVLRRQIMADGSVSKEERRFLRHALEHGNCLDEESFHILLELLLTGKRAE
jgi:hypothetical protein